VGARSEEPRAPAVEAVLGLGANLGERAVRMRDALSALAAHPAIRLRAVSSLYETAPWGMTDQPAFLNAAALVSTTLPPRALLDAILSVEAGLGRPAGRREKWGPRTIDIDILTYGDRGVAEPGLVIPHPHLHERAFALAPLLDVAPHSVVNGRPAADWLAALDRTGIARVADADWWREPRPPGV
jgi:2-amino-4-hydroxy-6-hydroxymethyldihydropteridine diphosphokinase